MQREPLSVVVITLNNAATLDACLSGVDWADEIVVLDSGSSDATTAIAAHYGARIHAQPFAGYSAQKQAAIDLASHRWVLLLDSDESLDADAAACLQQALCEPAHAGYQLWRREWQFWRWQSRRGRLNQYVRLFDRQHHLDVAQTVPGRHILGRRVIPDDQLVILEHVPKHNLKNARHFVTRHHSHP